MQYISLQVIWEGPLGTVAVIGIATKEAAAQCHGYVALLGSDSEVKTRLSLAKHIIKLVSH